VKNDQSEIVWSEEEYVAYLNAEHELFAWYLRKYGSYAIDSALEDAHLFYEYESPK
jgi:hypothetical protein